MRIVGVRELRQNASELLEYVAAGNSIEITNHGRSVARLVPVMRANGSSYRELVAQGVLRPGRGDPLAVQPVERPKGVPPTDALLALDRDETQ